ncbi:MAG: ArsR family transcriptional regulator [Candidatus Thorarchaeota archaeon]
MRATIVGLNTLTLDRRAYLHWIRNIERGLTRRTEILQSLGTDEWRSVAEIAQSVEVTTATILYHLHNMEREQVVKRNPEGKGWKLGPIQQSSLEEFLKPKRKRKKK